MKADYELRTSQYDYPDRPPGQHTNGPAKLFVRRPDAPWYRVRIQTNAHAVRTRLDVLEDESLRPFGKLAILWRVWQTRGGDVDFGEFVTVEECDVDFTGCVDVEEEE